MKKYVSKMTKILLILFILQYALIYDLFPDLSKSSSSIFADPLRSQGFPVYESSSSCSDFPDVIEIDTTKSLQQTTYDIFNLTGVKNPSLVQFTENIWTDVLGTDSLALQNSEIFQTGLIVTNSSVGSQLEEEVNNSLFVRIGNTGYGLPVPESGFNPDLNENEGWSISSGLSAGWKIPFTISSEYEVVNISFNWRFDAIDGAFDYDRYEYSPGVFLDENPDFQEVRARISHINPVNSFWLENDRSPSNPNGTIYYRRGPVVDGDEVWYQFNYLFQVSPDDYTLELGAYLNTREFELEYFDVWFDEIYIQGIDNLTDNLAPVPKESGLNRTADITQYEFFATFREGLWETPVKNVTVFYNTSSGLNTTAYNSTLSLVQTSYIDNAGYNNSYWNFSTIFQFNDSISYYYLTYDYQGNNYVSQNYYSVINDTVAPKITSSLSITNPSFIRQLGNGSSLICVTVYDWGNNTEEVKLWYRIGTGDLQSQLFLFNGTHYITKVTFGFLQTIYFNITLKDGAGNSNTYSGYSTKNTIDSIAPTIISNSLVIYPSKITENKNHVNISAFDPFGEIRRVFVEFWDLQGVLKFNVTLTSRGVLNQYFLSQPLDLPYNQSYIARAVVRDQSGLNATANITYTALDSVVPQLDIQESEYFEPGKLKVFLISSDTGSGLKSLEYAIYTPTGWSSSKSIELTGARYSFTIHSEFIGNERIEIRISAIDNAGNEKILTKVYTTSLFFLTPFGLLFTDGFITFVFVFGFTMVKIIQARRVRVVRRKRFDVALSRSERLAYLGEEAIFGFIAAYGQREGSSSVLLWEPRLIGGFYQYLKELVEKAHSRVDFIMRMKPKEMVSYIDFNIEDVACTAILFAYPAPTLPQQWLSTISLDQVPSGPGQGILLIMLLMREQWNTVSQSFQEEITEGVLDVKNRILAGETKESILEQARNFRRFISETIEVLDEIEVESEDFADSIMDGFENTLLEQDSEKKEDRR